MKASSSKPFLAELAFAPSRAGLAGLAGLAVLAVLAGTLGCHPRVDAYQQLLSEVHAPWTKLRTEPYKGKQDDIFFLNPTLGWYVNGKGKIFKTVDGGQTWTLQITKPGTYFRSIGFVDEKHGFAGNLGPDYFPGVTDATPLYETFDGGDTWNPAKDFPLPKGGGVCAIDIQDDAFINAGVLDHRKLVHVAGRVGGPAYLVRSVDGGQTWKLIDLNRSAAMVTDVRFLDANTGYIAAATDREIERSHASVLKTTDGGETWQRVYESARPFEMIWKISFPTASTGYATVMTYDENPASIARLVAKTSDAGKTWTELPLVLDHDQQEYGIAFASPDVGWVGMEKGGFQTKDGGKTWTQVEMGNYVNKIRLLRTNEGLVGYAIGGSVYRLQLGGATPVAAAQATPTDGSEPVAITKP